MSNNSQQKHKKIKTFLISDIAKKLEPSSGAYLPITYLVKAVVLKAVSAYWNKPYKPFSLNKSSTVNWLNQVLLCHCFCHFWKAASKSTHTTFMTQLVAKTNIAKAMNTKFWKRKHYRKTFDMRGKQRNVNQITVCNKF